MTGPSGEPAPRLADSPPARPGRGDVPATRVSKARIRMGVGMVVLVVILVFILENLHDVKVTFFGAHWRIPLGIDLLFATVLGGLIVFAAGSLRVMQLRRVAKRQGGPVDHKGADHKGADLKGGGLTNR